MPIDTTCPSCGRTLRVAQEHAGKQAKCPVCNHLYTVPGPSSGSPGEPASAADMPSTDTSQWSLKTPEGAIYGPVDRATLDRWLADGRIATDCYLAQGNSGSWQRAAEIYPQLSSRPNSQGASPASGSHWASDSVRTSTVGFHGVGNNTHLRPHRGGLILALGILGLMSCQLLGIIAWLMGSDDLREIRAGRMDPSGEGLTQAGVVLGMISALLAGIALVGAMLFLLIFAAAATV
jgi:hypothetical protein